jgi:hypothetical protein
MNGLESSPPHPRTHHLCFSRLAQLSESPIGDTIVPAFIRQCVSFRPHLRVTPRRGRSARQPLSSTSETTTGECVHEAWNDVRGPRSLSRYFGYISPKSPRWGLSTTKRDGLSHDLSALFFSASSRAWEQTKQAVRVQAQNSRHCRMPPATELPTDHDPGRWAFAWPVTFNV